MKIPFYKKHNDDQQNLQKIVINENSILQLKLMTIN